MHEQIAAPWIFVIYALAPNSSYRMIGVGAETKEVCEIARVELKRDSSVLGMEGYHLVYDECTANPGNPGQQAPKDGADTEGPKNGPEQSDRQEKPRSSPGSEPRARPGRDRSASAV